MKFVAIENLKSVDELNIGKDSILVAHDAVDFDLYESINFDKKTLRNKLDITRKKSCSLYRNCWSYRDMKIFKSHLQAKMIFVLGDDGTNFKNLLNVNSFPKNLKFRGYLDKTEVSMYQKSSDILLNLIEDTSNINFALN